MMNHSWALRGVAGSLLLLAAAAQTRADPIAWTYQWSSSPQVLFSSSKDSFLVLPVSGANPITTGTQNVTGTLLTYSPALAGSPETIPQTPYNLTLTLTDQATGQQLPVNIQGTLGGTVWSGGASLNDVITSPTTQTVQAGDNLYRVTFESLGAPSPNGQITTSMLNFQVDPQHAPEPSTLVLGLLSMPFFLTSARKARRRAASSL